MPELAREGPTSLIIVHGAFTALHVISELRSRFELGVLTRDDKHMLAQLGRDIADEIEKESFNESGNQSKSGTFPNS